MNSRKKTIRAIRATEKRLYKQQAEVNVHKYYWSNWLKSHRVAIVAALLPAAIFVWRANRTKGIQSLKHFTRLLVVSAVASARSRLIHSFLRFQVL